MQPPEFFPRTVGVYMSDDVLETPEKGQGTERASDRRMRVVTSGVIGGIIAFGILGFVVVVAAVMINWMNKNSEIHGLEFRVELLERQLEECRDGKTEESDAARAARGEARDYRKQLMTCENKLGTAELNARRCSSP